MKTLTLLTAAAALGLGTVLAQAAAHDDAVKARQELMKTIGAQTKILGTQAKAGDAFDAEAAQAAAAKLVEAAAEIPAVFETDAMNDDSEALPKIWENWEDFVAKSEALETAASAATDVASAEAMGAAMGDIGGACKACHSEYRQDK